jgi:uncharacterized protein
MIETFRSRLRADEAQSLQQFSQKVYGWLSLGTFVTAIVALLIPTMFTFVIHMPFVWILSSLGMIGISIAIRAGVNSMSYSTMTSLFMTYSMLQGLVFGAVLPLYASVYGGELIWTAFLSTAGLYSVGVVYGTYTKNDLTSIRSILSVGLFGLFGISMVAMVMAMFGVSINGLSLIIAYVGLAIFIGLTITDAQKIRYMNQELKGHSEQESKYALYMSFSMYINLIAIFWYVLRILSSSRSRN